MDKSWSSSEPIGLGGFARVYADGHSRVVKQTECEATQFLLEKYRTNPRIRAMFPAVAHRESATAWALERLYASPREARLDVKARALRAQFFASKPHYQNECFAAPSVPATFLRWAPGKSLQQLALYSPWSLWQQTFAQLRVWKADFEAKRPGLTYEADFRAANVMYDMFGQPVFSDPVAPWPAGCDDPYMPKEMQCDVLLYWQFQRPGMSPASVLCGLPLLTEPLRALADETVAEFEGCSILASEDARLWRKLVNHPVKSWTQGTTPAQERLARKLNQTHLSLHRFT